MLRSLVVIGLVAVVYAESSASMFSKPYQLTQNDVKVVNTTGNGVCFTLANTSITNQSTPNGYCSMGCYQCSTGCMQLYGMSWSCCENTYCCCYPSPSKCALPGMKCTVNYC